MKLDVLVKDLPQALSGIEITDITNNSEKVTKGTLFVCVKGTKTDGHRFANSAFESGAAAILTEKDLGLSNQVIVDDTRAAYAYACSAFFGHPSKKMKIIGVTGTNGKTTVTYLLKSMLERFGCKVGLIGTICNMIGDETIEAHNTTPEAYELQSLLARMADAGCEYVVMEVSSHALDQKRVYGIEFEVAIFTNLTQDHLDYHGTMENYRNAKKLLFKSSKNAIINIDDENGMSMVENSNCKVVTYSSVRNDADYLAKGIVQRADGTSFEFVGNEEIGHVKLKTPGVFSVYNAMAAGCCAIALGYPFKDVVSSLSLADGVKGRAEVVPTGRDFTVIIDYAHTPDGLKNILSTINACKSGRLVTLFGCGGDRDSTKRPIMGEVAARMSDFVIVTSDNPRSEDPQKIIEDIVEGMKYIDTPYKVVENRAQAIQYAVSNAQKGDIIVLAGKGHETYQVLSSGTIHFDEREVVALALENL